MRYLLLFSLLLFFSLNTNAQLSQLKRESSIRTYIKDSKQHVPLYILDSLLEGYQRGLSGSSIKEGKVASSSLSIDEKGASVQIAIKSFEIPKGTVYSGINLSGRGDDKFVNLFKDNRYANTLSGGMVFNIFPYWGNANFVPSERAATKAHTTFLQLSFDTRPMVDPFDITGQVAYLSPLLIALQSYESARRDFIENHNEKAFDLIANKFEDAVKGLDTLIALDLLPKDFTDKKPRERESIVLSVTFDQKTNSFLRQRNYIKKAEQVLMKANWTSVDLQWFTLKANYNVTPQPIIDNTLPDNNYLTSYNDKYLTWSLGYNFTRKYNRGSEFQYTISPTISFSTSRDFSGLKKITINKTEKYLEITGDTVTKVVFSSEGYEQIAEKKLGWSFEFPFILFWGKSNIGLDLAVRAGQNNPEQDNFGGRLGVYIPIEIKDGTPIWIEPVIRIGKLFEKQQSAKEEQMNFWKDNVVVGFNLSVALKQVTAFMKK